MGRGVLVVVVVGVGGVGMVVGVSLASDFGKSTHQFEPKA